MFATTAIAALAETLATIRTSSRPVLTRGQGIRYQGIVHSGNRILWACNDNHLNAEFAHQCAEGHLTA
jgi:hypothetical protein